MLSIAGSKQICFTYQHQMPETQEHSLVVNQNHFWHSSLGSGSHF